MKALAALVSLALAGCDGASAATSGPSDLPAPLLVLESDLATTSGLARADASAVTESKADPALGADAILVDDGAGNAIVLNRTDGVLLFLDGDSTHVTKRVGAEPPGAKAANPQDVARDAAGELWVALLDRPGVGVLDASGAWKGSVDLSAFDVDGVPEASAVRVVGDRAFVVLERLDPSFSATMPGEIVAIDTATKKVDGAPIVLPGKNPYGRLRPFPDDARGASFALCIAGNLAIGAQAIDASSGIAVVDLEARSAHLAVSEKDLGGFCSDVVIASAHEGYAIVSDADNDQNRPRVVAFDPSAGKVTGDVLPRAGGYRSSWAGLALVGDDLVVGDRTPGALALVVVDRATRKVKSKVGLHDLPPWSLFAPPAR